MVAMKCHAKMIPFYSNGEQIGITWSIPEIWTNCIAQLLSVAAVSEVCLGQRPSCNKSCQISPAHPEVNIRQWKKNKKESISTTSTFTIRFTIAITIININMMHAYTLCVGCRFFLHAVHAVPILRDGAWPLVSLRSVMTVMTQWWPELEAAAAATYCSVVFFFRHVATTSQSQLKPSRRVWCVGHRDP